MHSCLGIDYVSVEGATNGTELLLFFEEAVGITTWDGSVILKRGDTVIMDNCTFHHYDRLTKSPPQPLSGSSHNASPLVGEKHCVTSIITAAKETKIDRDDFEKICWLNIELFFNLPFQVTS